MVQKSKSRKVFRSFISRLSDLTTFGLDDMDFTDEQVTRYSRHILLPEVGGKGQKKIAKAKILIVGAGGLGSPDRKSVV